MSTLKAHARRRLQGSLLSLTLLLAACGGPSPQALIETGREQLAKKEYTAAVISFRSALQSNPRQAEARLLLGQALLASGDPAGAVAELNRALDEKASADRVMPLLAKALLLSGDYKKLTGSYNDLQLGDKQALADLKSTLATAWGALGDREHTLAAVKAALEAVPDHAAARILSARVQAGQGQFN